MSIKEQAIAMIRRLPDDAGLRDIEEELALLAALQEAEEDIRTGRLVTNDEMKGGFEVGPDCGG
jgi:predicted transcriptional regulator